MPLFPETDPRANFISFYLHICLLIGIGNQIVSINILSDSKNNV